MTTKNKISANGINLIKKFEGLRLKAYICSGGSLTIGYGHTKSVRIGQVITSDQAEELLKKDIEEFEHCVNLLVQVDMLQFQYDALVSLAYNIGAAAFKQSKLLKLLNNRDYDLVPEQFLRWNKAKKMILPGLTRRRIAERDMFLGVNPKKILAEY